MANERFHVRKYAVVNGYVVAVKFAGVYFTSQKMYGTKAKADAAAKRLNAKENA